MLLGRDRERHEIERVLATASGGQSAILAMVGEPGIGKTALLDYAAERAQQMRLLRARGVESEAQIPFAALLELLRPALGAMEQIPGPQALALEGALALRPAVAQERFAVGAATLSLLSAWAEERPLAVLIDDVHWLDGSSAGALLFAFRRLVADQIAVVMCVREDEPSLLDGADLPTLRIGGLSGEESELLLDQLAPQSARRLHVATGGNPLALIELAADASELEFAPEGAPLLISTTVSREFLRRVGELDDPVRRALVLAAASDRGELTVLERAARRIGVELSALAGAESAGLVRLRAGSVEFRHPLARSAIYADATAELRRSAHRALADALPDRDIDRRAWHLAAGTLGTDESASTALEQAAARAHARSAYAAAVPAFERAAQLAPEPEKQARLLLRAAESSWQGGLAERAGALLEQARELTSREGTLLDIDELAGHIAIRRGPIMLGHAILTMAAKRADPERAVAMLAEAASACFLAGNPVEMLAVAGRGWSLLPDGASARTRFLATIAFGMAQVFGADAALGSELIQQATDVVRSSPELRDELQLLPWLAESPIFLREAGTGRPLLHQALEAARARAAIGVLALVLNLIALDHATTDRWAVAEAAYLEAISLARESGQQTDLAFGLSGLARLQARRGREQECRADVTEALELCERLGTRLQEVWAVEALGILELGLGQPERAVGHFERQQRLLNALRITDADLSPAPELVDAHIRLGQAAAARRLAEQFSQMAEAKGQPWSLARAHRCRGQVAEDDGFVVCFEEALRWHAQTPDAFETARTRLAFGECLRRARNRRQAREQLRAAAETFDRLAARPWLDRTQAELAASGERLRRRDPTTLDELTPQELQIALLLAGGKTTRETAARLFLSPKTVEYHLRHVYLKLGIHSRAELARTMTAQATAAAEPLAPALS